MNNFITNKSFKSYLDLLLKIPMAMRITAVLLFIFLFQANAEVSYSQSTKISLNLNNATVEQVLNAIEENSDFYFLYNSKLINVDRKVDVNAKEKTIENVLKEVFNNTNVQYKVEDKQIILSNKSAAIQQQQQTVSGVVMDQNLNEPIIGANVVVKGTTNGTITDIDGKFTLPVSSHNDIILISYIGYMPLEMVASQVKGAKIFLKEDSKTLDEVVVVGYGVQKKANVTGSVASLNAEALESRSVSSVSAALAGQMPGVTAIQSSGAPGAQTGSITIRGKNSINAASPLVIVDGVPGNMNTLDPSDIATLTVLKDASSAAIYGVQAANGVILITTKKGKKGDAAKISYSGTVAWTTPTAKLKFLGSADYATLYNEAVLNENPKAVVPYTAEDIELFRNGTDPIGHPNTDWYDETFKSTAMEQMHHLSLSGGTEKTSYNASIGYTQQNGFIEQNKYQRYNIRTNIESEVTNWLSAGLNISGYRGVENNAYEGLASLLQYANRLKPTVPVYTEQGDYTYIGLQNPVAHLGTTGFSRNTNQQLNAIFQATVKILPELSVKGVFSVRNDMKNSDGFKKHLTYGSGSNIYNSGDREGYAKNYDWNWYTTQLLVNYNKTFGSHSVGLLGGFEQVDYKYKYLEATRKGGGNDDLTESLNTLDKSSQTNKDGGHETARQSYFGRAQYDFSNKYLFEANFRADASSRFPKGNRWGFFPAFSAGWRITEENFLKESDLTWISNLKLRLGWGQTGNEELDPNDIYPSISTYAYDTYMYGNTLYSTAKESRYVNSLLKWATVTNYEVALETGFLDNKIGFELAAYKKITNDMLLYLPVQGVLGMDGPAQNAGSVENTGFDLSVFHNNRINKDLSYALNFNLAYVKNEITDMRGTEGPNPDNGKYWYLEGYPTGSFYGYEAIGFFNTADELANQPKRTGKEKLGDIKYADLNKDGKIDAANDRKVIGHDFPSWTAGFNANIFYKDFDLSLFFQGAFDVQGYYSEEAAFSFFNSGKVLERHLDRWTPTNLDASYPRITKDSQINFQTSSFWLQDASYVRLKNVSFGYNLPKSILGKLNIDRVKVYVSGENLLTFSGLDGIDPEAPASNRGAFYSNVKKVSLGLKVSF